MKSQKLNIPFFDYNYFHRTHEQELTKIFKNVLSRGAFILQSDLVDFENSFAEYLGVKHAIGVANCTDGLYLSLRAANIGPGDEVIFPSHTFVATASAIKDVGAIPVPVECGSDHLIDPIDIHNKINDRTKAIIPVQLNGRTCNMDKIHDIATQNDLIIIEDAAQSLGASFKGKRAGTFGLLAAFSFYPAKVLPCFGDGGMVVTDSDEMADKIYKLRDHGRGKDGNVSGWGVNSRLDNLQASFLKFFLHRYDDIVARRREIASLYHARLSDIKDLLLPPSPKDDGIHFDVFQNFEVESSYRDDFEVYLKANGISTIRQWGGKVVHQLDGLGFDVSLKNTEQMISKSLLLPLNLSLTDNQVYYICDKVLEFYDMNQKKQSKKAFLSV